MSELTPIQKEIEARNVEIGRKLLRYPKLQAVATYARMVCLPGMTGPALAQAIAYLREKLDDLEKTP